jgi:hypothetical protein
MLRVQTIVKKVPFANEATLATLALKVSAELDMFVRIM